MARPIALVTGASSGIGAAFARRLARDGYDLALVARREDRLRALAEDHGATVEVLVADLGEAADVRRIEARLTAAPPIDMLVNNAGFGIFKPLAELDPEVMDEMVRVNVMSLLRLTRAVVPAMLERGGGSIINVCSGTVFYPMANCSIYMATKSMIYAFTRSLYEDVGRRGIAVQALVPGTTETEFFQRATGADDWFSSRPGMVLQPDDLVEASLAGLKTGEMVCIPSLPDYEAFNRYHQAELEVLSGVSRDRVADRYRA